MDEEFKHPGRYTVHWPTGPVIACREHAQGLVILGGVLGMHIHVEEHREPAGECANCQNRGERGTDPSA